MTTQKQAPSVEEEEIDFAINALWHGGYNEQTRAEIIETLQKSKLFAALVAELEQMNGNAHESVWKLSCERDSLREQLKAASGALEVYANRDHWGSFDESGCRKSTGNVHDTTFIPSVMPWEEAEDALAQPQPKKEGA